MRCGTSPVLRKREKAFSSTATCASSMATSTKLPAPVRLRSCRAARMPVAVNRLAVISPIEAPTRTGPRPASPVMLIMPDIACTTASKAGRALYGPVWPKPEMAA